MAKPSCYLFKTVIVNAQQCPTVFLIMFLLPAHDTSPRNVVMSKRYALNCGHVSPRWHSMFGMYVLQTKLSRGTFGRLSQDEARQMASSLETSLSDSISCNISRVFLSIQSSHKSSALQMGKNCRLYPGLPTQED